MYSKVSNSLCTYLCVGSLWLVNTGLCECKRCAVVARPHVENPFAISILEAHWIQRTRQPQLQDPVFAMATKAALDSKQSWKEVTGDLLANMKAGHTGMTVCFACTQHDW